MLIIQTDPSDCRRALASPASATYSMIFQTTIRAYLKLDGSVLYYVQYYHNESIVLTIPFPISVSIDDFYRGTRAALVGGTTTVVDCVAPESGESLMDAYNKWRGWAEDKVCCNYALRWVTIL